MRLPTPSATYDAAAVPYALPVPGGSQSLLRHFERIDVCVLFAWVMSTTLPFGWTAPLRYMAAAYFAGAMLLFARQTMPAVFRAWPTLIIPLMCVISAMWAPSANEAIRKGALFALTAVVAIYAASRLSGRQILTTFMLVELIAAVLTILKPTLIGGAWTGIFGQKNFLAVHMFTLFACALALTFDKGSNRWIRLIALAMVPTAAFVIIMARSGTTTLLLVGCAAALIVHALLWTPASRVRHMRMLLLLGVSVIALAAFFMLFALMQFDAYEYILNALGKDSTLTGRTYLWETAERVMREHPMTGVGADGFWRQEFGAANSITEYFHYETYVKFSFHNSYLENGVAFGYPGYWATVLLACWAIWRTAMNWVRNQTIINACFLALAVMIIIRSTAEIDLALEFAGTAVLLFIGATRKENLTRRPAPAPRPDFVPAAQQEATQ
jgi:exopolysaccharide production protein ExoQ